LARKRVEVHVRHQDGVLRALLWYSVVCPVKPSAVITIVWRLVCRAIHIATCYWATHVGYVFLVLCTRV